MPKNLGKFGLAGAVTPAQITANQNDYAPTGHAGSNTLRISSDAEREITGLAGGEEGRLVVLDNIGSFPIQLQGSNALSVAANRFVFGPNIASTVTVHAGTNVVLRYDGTTSRWRFVANSGRISTLSATILNPTAGQTIMLHYVSTHATALTLRGHRKGGTGATINFQNSQTNKLKAADLSITGVDSWVSAAADQNTSILATDIEAMVVTVTGAVTEITLQLDLLKAN